MVLFVWLTALTAQAVDVRGYGVFKTQDFLQTSTNVPVLQTNWPAYSFSAIVQPLGPFSNQVNSASVETPPPGFVDPLTPPVPNTDQPFASYFGASSQAIIDANYPTGAYTLRIFTAHDGDKVLTLSMTNLSATSFPTNPPRIANFNQAQSVNAATNFVLTWDAFSGGTTNDSITLSIADANGAVVFRSATFGLEPGLTFLAASNTSILIPSNSLAAGQTYNGYLIFEKDPVVQTNYTGARGLVGFAKATSFTLKTTGGEPPPPPPMLQAMGFSANQFTLRLWGATNKSFVIYGCTNLASPSWVPLVTNTAANGFFNFTDTTSGNPRRFYRAQFKP